MSHAQAAHWRLSKSRAVQGIAAGVYALSADDRWLAAMTQDRQALRLLDLHTFDVGKTIRLGRPADRLAFDSPAQRVIAICDASPAQLAVVELQKGTTVSLPMPIKRAVPAGSLLWWKEHEVLIGSSEKDLRILNLETLEVDAASALPSWKQIKLAEQERIIQGMTLGLRETARWKWGLQPYVERSELPEVEGTDKWSVGLVRALAMTHPERDFCRVFPDVGARDGDLFFSSGDGAKVFRARGSTLDIFYFDLSPSPPLRWTLAMPHEVSGCRDAQKATGALKLSRLCALVYAPLLNPLNGRVVGPKRDRVKAVLTFESWEGRKAECYASQLLSPIDPGDVVADLCVLDGPSSELLSLDTQHRWWAMLPDPQPDSADANCLPKRECVAASAALARKTDDKAQAEGQLAKAPGFAFPSTAIVLPEKGAEDRIRDFVTTHHIAAKAGDVEKLVMDYAERVDYFNSGWVDRESIRQDELKYHRENAVLEQRILGMISVAPSTSSLHAVTYELRVTVQNRSSGQAKTFTFDVSLGVAETPDGLKIERQKAVKQP